MPNRLWEVRYLLTDVSGAIEAASPSAWWPFVGPGKRALLAGAVDQLLEADQILRELDLDWLSALAERAVWASSVPAADLAVLKAVLAQVEARTSELGEDQPPPIELSESSGGRARYRRGVQSSAPMMAG